MEHGYGRCSALRALFGFFAAVALTACDLPQATLPTTPSPSTVTDTFTGSFAQSGAVVHPFAVAVFGTIEVRLTSVSPLATMGLGAAIGNWDGSTCTTTTTSNSDARTGSVALRGSIDVGNYCVRIFDSGNVPADWTITYSVEIAHP